MKLDDVEAVLQEFVLSTGIELRVEGSDWSVRARREHAPAVVAAASTAAPAEPPPPAEAAILAPLVGHFQWADPPIAVGDRIEAGQVVGGIDSLRVLTSVQTAVAGEIVAVLVDDGYPVEYGQELFHVRTEDSSETALHSAS